MIVIVILCIAVIFFWSISGGGWFTSNEKAVNGFLRRAVMVTVAGPLAWCMVLGRIFVQRIGIPAKKAFEGWLFNN